MINHFLNSFLHSLLNWNCRQVLINRYISPSMKRNDISPLKHKKDIGWHLYYFWYKYSFVSYSYWFFYTNIFRYSENFLDTNAFGYSLVSKPIIMAHSGLIWKGSYLANLKHPYIVIVILDFYWWLDLNEYYLGIQ